MKTKLRIITALTLVAFSGATLAGHASDYSDRAMVLSSTPIYQQVNEPRKECWTETNGYQYRQDHSYGGAIIGAITGGLLGSTVGRGNGKVAVAAIGAATGALVGDRLDNRDRGGRYEPRQVEQCRVEDNWKQVITGYNVVYRYGDRNYTTTLPYDPGRSLTVNVDVRTADRQNRYDDRSPWGSPWGWDE